MQFINAYLKLATDAQVREFARVATRTDIYRDVECVTLRGDVAARLMMNCAANGGTVVTGWEGV
jgi:hypothetical protein